MTVAEPSVAPTPHRRARLSGARVALALLAIAPLARAQGGTTENASMAEALFRDGVSLFDAGHVHEACAKFVESYRLDPANGTLLNQALCHEREGKTATAWAEYALLAGRAAQAGQKDREKMARARVEDLERKLARVTLVIDRDAEVAQIAVDGDDLGRGAWSTPLPLDPGAHTFTFRAPGKRAASRAVTVPATAANVRVVVPALEDEAPVVVAAPSAPTAPSAPIATPEARGGGQRTAAWIIGGAGVVFVGAGAFFGLETLAKKRDVDAHCAGAFCDAAGIAADHDAHQAATWATAGFAAGVGALGAAAVLWLTAPSSEVGIAPTAGGARIVGRF